MFDASGTLAQTRSRVYDSLNHLFQDIGGVSPATEITQYGYDNQGNLTGITDPLSRILTNAYDPLNRLALAVDPAGGIARYGYDGLDQLANVADPRNLLTSYTQDGLGNLAQTQSPDTGLSNAVFDAAGNVATRTDARSMTTTYRYDALNRISSTLFQGGGSLTFTYDQGANGKGRLATTTWPGGQTTFAYDPHGRVTQKTQVHTYGPTLSVSYNWNQTTGRLDSITYPSGKGITLSYDAAGRVSGLAVGTTSIATNIAYVPFGPPSGWTWGNGAVVAR